MNVVEVCQEVNWKVNCDEIDFVFGVFDDYFDFVLVCSFVESWFGFVYEFVCCVDLLGGVLYWECLVWLWWGECDVLLLFVFLLWFEVFGLMCWFDWLVVGCMIDVLCMDLGVVYGCNVVVVSVVVDDVWLVIFRWFECEFLVVVWLVIEIMEMGLLNFVVGWLFVNCFWQVGCWIVIDDFGVGFSVLNNLVVGNFDIVKLDWLVLLLIKCNVIGCYQFCWLIVFVYEGVWYVVVEGVESEIDWQIIMDVGVVWVQGICFLWWLLVVV